MKILTYTSERGKERSCDARCYNSFAAKCTCVCGGVNHGKGFKLARQLTFDVVVPALLDRESECKVEIPEAIRQEEMFK